MLVDEDETNALLRQLARSPPPASALGRIVAGRESSRAPEVVEAVEREQIRCSSTRTESCEARERADCTRLRWPA